MGAIRDANPKISTALASDFVDEAPGRDPLGQRALSAGAWTLLGWGAGRAAKFASQLFLARLLVPEDFGLWAIVAAVQMGLQMFSDFGVGPAIIQSRRGDDREFLDTAFTVQALRGLALSLLCVLGSVPLAHLYGRPELTLLLIAVSLSPLLQGLASTSLWTLARRMDLRNLTLLGVLSDFGGAALSVVWAILYPSVWALLAGSVGSAALLSAGSHLLVPNRDRLRWRREHARAISRFGRGIFLSTATNFLAAQSERLLLGKLLGLATLGVMSIVFLVVDTARTAIGRVMSRVLFPMISESLRDDVRNAERQFQRARRVSLLASLLIAGICIPFGKPLMQILFDPRYDDAGWMFEILSIRIVIAANSSPAVNFLLARGLTGYAALGNTIVFLSVLLGLTLGTPVWGVHYSCWLLVLSSAPGYAITLWGLYRHSRVAFAEEARCLAVALLAVAFLSLVNR